MSVPPSPSSSLNGRAPGLDLLRAAAIVWVLIFHSAMFGLTPPGAWIVKFGWMGVDLFFALSGFLIAGQLLRPLAGGVQPDYGRFFVRRLMRTLPAYLAILAVYALFPQARERPLLSPLWRFLTFTQNIGLDPSPPKAFTHAWSLCVEEQFYLALPLVLVWLAPRATPRRVVGVLAAVLTAGMALRGWLWLQEVARAPFQPFAPPRGRPYMVWIYYPTWSRLDGLLAGISAAALQSFRPAAWARLTSRGDWVVMLGLGGVLVATLAFAGQIGGLVATVLGFPLIALSMGLLVIGASSPASVAARLAAAPGVRALAAGAYSLYLSHKIIFGYVERAAAGWPVELRPLAPWSALAGALLAGAALYWVVERPFLRLRDRLGRPAARCTPDPIAAG